MNVPKGHTPPRTAFTLLELLVVLVIIAVLAALLLFAVSKSRSRARIVICGKNLKEIGTALAAYRHDLGDYPFATLMPAPFQSPHPGKPLPGELFGYLSPQSKVYRCPGDTDQVYEPTKAASPIEAGLSYAYEHAVTRMRQRSPDGPPDDELLRDYVGDSIYGLVRPPVHPEGKKFGWNTLTYDGRVTYAVPRW